MRAGNLDRRVTIYKKTVAVNAYGEPVETWVEIDTIWAQRRELRGTERWEAQRTNPTIECKYIIRWRADVDVKHRLVDGDRDYNIRAVLELGRREGLELVVAAREN